MQVALGVDGCVLAAVEHLGEAIKQIEDGQEISVSFLPDNNFASEQ
jgi:hypothetical protein